MSVQPKRYLIIGGGAAGYMAALNLSERLPGALITIAEASKKPLQKVRISGGGRCNITHSCFEQDKLLQFYPRGQAALQQLFARFQPRHTVEWFSRRGVKLKTEADGRIFPASDSSETVISFFETARKKAKVDLKLASKVNALQKNKEGKFLAVLGNGKAEQFEKVLIATGGSRSGYSLAESLGHSIQPLAPSLFTFKVQDLRLEKLSGLSVNQSRVELKIKNSRSFQEQGALLVTHWGLSGPVVIRLSAWAARELKKCDYMAEIVINWTAGCRENDFKNFVAEQRNINVKKQVSNCPFADVPKRLWQSLCEAAELSSGTNWSELSRAQAQKLEKQVFEGIYKLSGKGEFKEEFVTCGGVSLSEVDIATMESKLVQGLYFAGEVLDIDGVTGGFNFQSAWSTGFVAAAAM